MTCENLTLRPGKRLFSSPAVALVVVVVPIVWLSLLAVVFCFPGSFVFFSHRTGHLLESFMFLLSSRALMFG